jgi:hypothetical protein
MFVRIGATVETAAYIVGNESYDDMDVLSRVSTKDIDALCRSVTHPGGLLANGQPNRGQIISSTFQKQLHLATYYLQTRRRVSRNVEPANITLAIVTGRMLHLRRELEKAYENPTNLKVEINRKDWPKTLGLFERALAKIMGTDGTPLDYCVRENAEVPAEATDPEAAYANLEIQMRTRAPILAGNGVDFSDTFLLDNRTVWNEVANTFEGTEDWPHIRSYLTTLDGRGAILKLRSLKMGTQYVQNQSGAVEKRWRELSWSGNKRNWTFDNYVTQHEECYNQLLELDGYQEPNVGTRVRLLMDGILTPILDSSKNAVYASDTLRTDFSGTCSLFTNFLGAIPNKGTENRDQRRNASELDTQGGGQGPADRFYSDEEYKKFTPAEKNQLWEKRNKTRQPKGDGGGKNARKKGTKRPPPGNYDKSIKALTTASKKQARQLAKLVSASTDDASSADDDAGPSADHDDANATSNRSNPALRRSRRRSNRPAA